jgi:AraC family transcriptional regulator
MLTREAVRETRGRRAETALPFSVSLIAAGESHEDEFGAHGATMFQVHFDFEPELSASRAPRGWTWLYGGPVVREFVQLVRDARRGESADLREQRVLDVLATASAHEATSDRPPAWLRRVREMIDDTHGWPIVSALARSADVHRVQRARQCRRYYRCSVGEYIRHRRVQLAARLISTTAGAG